MPDSDDGATNRVSKLHAAMGRKETENAQLRARLAEYEAQEINALAQDRAASQDTPPETSQPELQPGTYFQVDDDGRLAEWKPPQPRRMNESRTADTDREPTEADLIARLDQMAGKSSRPDWDPTAT